MECVKMYYVVIFTLLAWSWTSEGINSTTFEGTKPVPVLVGSNVTLSWTYSGQEDQILIIFFSFLDGELKKMARYTLSTNVPSTIDLGGYCDSVDWVGNTTKKIAAFRMNNISRLAHEETFAVDIYSGPIIKDFVDRQTIFISVLPKVNLIVSKTNFTVGEMLTIECEVIQGRPEPTISWYKNGEVIPQETGKYLINNEKIQQNNAGSYNCKASNNADSISSKVVTITVNKKSGDQDNGKPETGSRSSGLGGGAIAGIVVAILFIIVIVIFVAFVMIKKKGKPAKTVRMSDVNGDGTQEAMVSDGTKDQVWL